MMIKKSHYIKFHYVLIDDLSKLLFNQNGKGKRRLEYCVRCLQHFSSKIELDNHLLLCNHVDIQRTEFPTSKNKYLSFKNFKNKIPAPFAVYADFEAFNKVCDILEELIKSLKKNSQLKN